jgi:glucokinase
VQEPVRHPIGHEPPARHVLSLDFGGTKLAAGVIDLGSSQLREAVKFPTPATADASLTALLERAKAMETIGQITAIGVSFGGHVRDDVVLRSMHIPGWEQFPLGERLRNAFGLDTVRIANDANAVALGEWRFGAGKGSRSLLYVTVSTGIGGGIVLDGRIWEGANGLAGEIGHMKVANYGLCSCGRVGCLEAVASGPGIVNRLRELLERNPHVPNPLRNREFSTFDVFSLTTDGYAVSVVLDAAHNLGRAIGNAVNLLDVDCVVIGGGVARSGEVWWDEVRKTIMKSVLERPNPVKVLQSGLGEYEGLWGAAALLP